MIHLFGAHCVLTHRYRHLTKKGGNNGRNQTSFQRTFDLTSGYDKSIFFENLKPVKKQWNWCSKWPKLTPLHSVSEPDGTNIIRFLLEKGADIGARTLWGDTAAHYAALKGTREVLDLVCAKGASIVKDKDNAGYRYIWEAWLVRDLGGEEILK